MVHATPRRRTERALTVLSGPAIEQFDQGRSCAHPTCNSVLSRYNPNDTCAAHGGWRQDRAVRKRQDR
jgi:hypothetical protein